MAALNAITPTNLGALSPGAAVAATDTISIAVMGRNGCLLEIINGNASTDNMTISDAGRTPAGNPLPAAGTIAVSVTNATSKIFRIRREQAEPVFGVVVITHNPTAAITYKLYPV